MNDKEAIKLLFGILLSYIIAKILKKLIKQSRPKGKTYGMPSSRATVITFIIFFLIMSYNFSMRTNIILILIGLATLLIKYYLKEHSINQLICGIILGCLIAYIFKNY
jgi:membrane-associated phospholipid phosphatase